jgi:hypothetical protein
MTYAPNGVVTLYVDPADSATYAYGASTIYEVYIYTTTQNMDVIGYGTQCGGAPASIPPDYPPTFPAPYPTGDLAPYPNGNRVPFTPIPDGSFPAYDAQSLHIIYATPIPANGAAFVSATGAVPTPASNPLFVVESSQKMKRNTEQLGLPHSKLPKVGGAKVFGQSPAAKLPPRKIRIPAYAEARATAAR